VASLCGIDGRRLGAIWSGSLIEGGARIAWNGRVGGSEVAAGIYFVEVRQGGLVGKVKIVKLK
jgi:hypothetical protein